MNVPGWLLVHQVTIEPYAGDGAYGPTYGAAMAVACFLDEKTRMVRDKTGREVTSSSTFYCLPDTVCPAESRVTLPGGRQTTVIASLARDSGGLGAPNHLEAQLQ